MNPVRTLSLLFVAAGLACGAGGPAWAAAVPDPQNSTVDPCVRVCPAGDMTFHVVVRDALANPIPESTVVVDFGGCFGFFLCPPPGAETYTSGAPAVVMMPTDASGVADFAIRAGGSCVGIINVYADGILLASRPANTSPDQNGDAMVDATDQALLAAKLGGPFDPNADLNCSAALGPGDATVQNAHLGHSCAAVVPVLPSSWGRIKTIYR